MRSVAELIEQLLTFNGFSVRRVDGFIAASKGSIRIMVRMEGDVETLNGTYIEEMRLAAEEHGYDRILLVHTGNIAQDARGLLERYHIVLWDRDRLSHELGRALLAGAEGAAHGGELPFMDYLRVPEGAVRVEEAAAKVAPAPPVEHPAVEATFAREAPPMGTGQSDILTFMEAKQARVEGPDTEERYVDLRVSREEALERAPRLRGAGRCDLQYIPFHLFDYQVELEDEVGDIVVKDNGTLAVNALTGLAQEWNLAMRMGGGPPADLEASVLRPSIDAMAAYEQANRAVKDLHTRVIERVEERGSVTVFVKRHVKPRDGAIAIMARGMIHMPVWCIEAPEGVAVVNASSGRIVKEEYLD